MVFYINSMALHAFQAYEKSSSSSYNVFRQFMLTTATDMVLSNVILQLPYSTSWTYVLAQKNNFARIPPI